MTGHLPARIGDSWTARLPRFADPDLGRYMAEVAAAMDDRQRRIGEHAARERPLWATQALGQVPDGAQARAEWEARAGRLGAYREMFGWDHSGEAIGPEPAPTSPEARAEWHAAFAAMARVEGIDVRHLTDGQLLARRRAYEAETSWAPKHVAEELRAARKQEQFSRVETTRHAYEAAAAARHGNADMAALHEKAADSWAALGQRASLVRDTLAEAHDTRCQWEAMTEPTRRLARAADIELKRRGVLSRDDDLRSAEPDGFAYPQREQGRDVWVQPRLAASTSPASPSQSAWPSEKHKPWKSSASPPGTTSPSCPIRSGRSPSTTATARPRSTSGGPRGSPPKNPTRWTSARPGTSSPNAAATPSSSHPSRRSQPPTRS
jgi:hypothetical protein